jgi:hypothetical protein
MLALSSMRFQSRSVPRTLVSHPHNTARPICSIEALVSEAGQGGLSLAFALEGDLSGLRIPEAQPPRRVGDLWRHTCFEAFVMAGEGPAYREFNLSPSGEWAVHAFRRYRDGGELEVELDPAIVVRRSAGRLELDAKIGPELVPPGRLLRLGLSAVLEAVDGALSYWALRHPPGEPDFHHIDAFALRLELSECAS